MRRNSTIQIRFLPGNFVQIGIGPSPERVVPSNFTKESFFHFTAVLASVQAAGEIGFHVLHFLRRGPGTMVVQDVWSAVALTRFRFGWQAPTDATPNFSRESWRLEITWGICGCSGWVNGAELTVGVSQGFCWLQLNLGRARRSLYFRAVWLRVWPLTVDLRKTNGNSYEPGDFLKVKICRLQIKRTQI